MKSVVKKKKSWIVVGWFIGFVLCIVSNGVRLWSNLFSEFFWFALGYDDGMDAFDGRFFLCRWCSPRVTRFLGVYSALSHFGCWYVFHSVYLFFCWIGVDIVFEYTQRIRNSGIFLVFSWYTRRDDGEEQPFLRIALAEAQCTKHGWSLARLMAKTKQCARWRASVSHK